MSNITIDTNGNLKLLVNHKADKDSDLDEIKPIVLKGLRNEISPKIKLIFEKTLQTGKLGKEWKTARVIIFCKSYPVP